MTERKYNSHLSD